MYAQYKPDDRVSFIYDSRHRQTNCLEVVEGPGFILARVVRVKNENGRKFTRKNNGDG